MTFNILNSQKKERTKSRDIKHVCLNQDRTYYSTSSDINFDIYRLSPNKNIYHNNNESGKNSLNIICSSFFHKSNIIGFVLEDKPHVFYLYELGHQEFRKDITNPKPIIDVRVHQHFIVLISEELIHVYDNNLRPTYMFRTFKNPRAICEVSQDEEIILIAFPDIQRGMVRVHREDRSQFSGGPIGLKGSTDNFDGFGENSDDFTVMKKRNRKIILKSWIGKESYVEDVECIGVDHRGNYVATVVKSGYTGSGILIYKIVTLKEGPKFQIYKMLSRGNWAGEVTSFSFSFRSQFISLTSLSGTLHVFSLGGKYQNPKVRFSVNNYESALWKERNLKTPMISCFVWNDQNKGTLLVINGDEIIQLKVNNKFGVNKKEALFKKDDSDTIKFIK